MFMCFLPNRLKKGVQKSFGQSSYSVSQPPNPPPQGLFPTEFLGLTLLGEQHSGFTPLWGAASWPLAFSHTLPPLSVLPNRQSAPLQKKSPVSDRISGKVQKVSRFSCSNSWATSHFINPRAQASTHAPRTRALALSLRSSARESHTRASPMSIPARRRETFHPPRRSTGYECPRTGEWTLRNLRITNANANTNDVVGPNATYRTPRTYILCELLFLVVFVVLFLVYFVQRLFI